MRAPITAAANFVALPALAALSLLLLLSLVALPSSFFSPSSLPLPSSASPSAPPVATAAFAEEGGAGKATIELKNSNYTYVDSSGMLNVVGIVNNKGLAPISVVMGLDVVDGKTGAKTTMQEIPYGRVLFPDKGAPFKFKVAGGLKPEGQPYILSVREVSQPFYNTLVLNYTNMAVGEGRVLTGTIKNTGPFEVRNVSVYASVHDEHTRNLDSVRSNVIPVLGPGEEAIFTAAPDPAVKAQVYYYSCAGFDPDAPIATIPTADGGFIAYDMQSVAKVSSLRYDEATDSIAFGIKPYNPAGGPATLKFAQQSKNQTVAVMMDGEAYGRALVSMDGKTVNIDMFIPPGDHEVQIQGVRAVPEFPFVSVGLAAAVLGGAVVAMRFKAAFKIS